MAREDLHFRLRLPEYLKELVEAAALEHGQSMTMEIVQRLHRSFDDDHATLKLPKDLQDRIRWYAERQHRSLNEEIVRLLEREFPAPVRADNLVDELLDLTSLLRSDPSDASIKKLTTAIFDALFDISEGKVTGLSKEAQREIADKFREWTHENGEESFHQMMSKMDEGEARNFELTGTTAKVIDPEFEDGK